MIEQTKHTWKKNTVLFLISQCITLFGSMIVQMSIIWYLTATELIGFAGMTLGGIWSGI